MKSHGVPASPQTVRFAGPTWYESSACEAVLRSLPEWFGIESALLAYARNTAELSTFVALNNDGLVGFVSLRKL